MEDKACKESVIVKYDNGKPDTDGHFENYSGLADYLKIIYGEIMRVTEDGTDDFPSVRFKVLSLGDIKISSNLSNIPKYFKECIKHYPFENGSNDFMPTITIGIEDMFDKDWESGAVFKLFNIDPRYAWIDSCIWLRYIQLTDTFEEDLKKLLEEIKLYHQLGMYNTVVAREYLEMMIRNLEDNYIEQIGTKSSKKSGKGACGHAEDITPYIYHSESVLRKQAQAIYKELWEYLKHSDINPVWRCLLVDDHGNDDLSAYPTGSQTKTVKVVLENLLNDLVQKSTSEDKSRVKIDLVEQDKENSSYVDGAYKTIKGDSEGNRYEAVILDYLLKFKHKGEDCKEFGTELLKKLREMKCRHRGPSDRFWIVPLTAHNTAFQDELIVQGIPHYDKNWYIAEGADLVLTPNKFLWILLSTFKIQLKESIFEFGEIVEFFETHPYSDKDNLQGWASYALGSFVNRFGKHTKYMMGAPESGFGKTVHTYYQNNPDLRFYYKSFVNLLMLISSGSKADWREIYERITRIEKILKSEKEEDAYDSVTTTFNEIKKTLAKWAAFAQ